MIRMNSNRLSIKSLESVTWRYSMTMAKSQLELRVLRMILISANKKFMRLLRKRMKFIRLEQLLVRRSGMTIKDLKKKITSFDKL